MKKALFEALHFSLRTIIDKSLLPEEIAQRKQTYGNDYTYPHIKPTHSFMSFLREASYDRALIITLLYVVLSIAFKFKTDEGWYLDTCILVALLCMLIFLTAFNNYKMQAWLPFQALIHQKMVQVEVIRGGRHMRISIFQLLVGDIVPFTTVMVDRVPSDGHSIKINTSGINRETELSEVNPEHPFLQPMVVTDVRLHTEWAKLMTSISDGNMEETPLQGHLNRITRKINHYVACLFFIILVVFYFTGYSIPSEGAPKFKTGTTSVWEAIDVVMSFFVIAVTNMVVGEELLLAVTAMLTYSISKVKTNKASFCQLVASETMGIAMVITICFKMTGTLNDVPSLHEANLGLSQGIQGTEVAKESSNTIIWNHDFGQSIVKSAAFTKDNANDVPSLQPSHETNINLFMTIQGTEVAKESSNTFILNDEFGQSIVKLVVVKGDKANNVPSLHDTNIGLSMDTQGTEVAKESSNTIIFNDAFDHSIVKSPVVIEDRANDVTSSHETNINLFVGIQGTEVVKESSHIINLNDYFHSIVEAVVVTRGGANNVLSLHEADIDLSMDIQGIEVVKESSDIIILNGVLHFIVKAMVVTRHIANIAPSLYKPNIGISMGIEGTKVAKERFDIIIFNDDFNHSIVKAVCWGHFLYVNIQKFIELKLTVNIATFVMNFVSMMTSSAMMLTTLQLLWVNLIMDIQATLALVLEPPTNELIKIKALVKHSKPLITHVMWCNLLGQSLFQIIIMLTFHFKGEDIFRLRGKPNSHVIKDTIIFTTFVLGQVFNQAFVLCQVFNKFKSFKGRSQNIMFMGIITIILVMQVIIVEFLPKFASTHKLTWHLWFSCIGIGFLSWLIACILRLIPLPFDEDDSYCGYEYKKKRALEEETQNNKNENNNNSKEAHVGIKYQNGT